MKKYILTFYLLIVATSFAQMNTHFVTTWNTNNGNIATNTEITIPTIGVGYNYDVDWNNDGTFDEFNIAGNVTHDYGATGIYTIRIRGDFPRIYFNNTYDARKLTNISQWGTIQWSSMEHAFYGCSFLQVTAIDVPNLSNVSSMNYMFGNCRVLDANFNNWDVSTVIDMSNLFHSAIIYNSNLNNWDVSTVTNMSAMFRGARDFNNNNQPLTWNNDTANVEDMSFIFYAARNFNQNISNWNVSAVTNMSNMFWVADSFNQSLLWGNNTTNVENMSRMFMNADLFNQDISGWNVSSVTNMSEMFSGNDAFNNGNLPLNWTNTSNVQFMNSMFSNAIAFNQDISNWDVSNVKNMQSMFNHANTFNNNNQPLNWSNTSKVENMRGMFLNAIAFNQDVSTWDVSSVTTMRQMFLNATNFNNNNQALDWNDTSNVTSMYYMFSESNFNQDVSTLDLSSVTTITGMFSGNNVFNQDISNWDVSVVTQTLNTFRDATAFNNAGQILNWGNKTSNFIDMHDMFNNASSFNQNINDWNVASVTNMSGMFQDATAFDQDIGAWNIQSLSNAFNMFLNVTLSTNNYDSLLISWQGQPHNNTVFFSGGNSKYCIGANAKNSLMNTDNWTISDGGLDPIGCENDLFITTWETTAPNESLTIPTEPTETYLYDVDWDGDSIFDAIGETGDFTHNYVTAGTHTIKIRGTFPRIYFSNGGDKNKILTINQWGTQQWTSMEFAFSGCSNLTEETLDFPDLTLATSMQAMFSRCTSLNDGLENWDVSTIKNMSHLFERCSIFNCDISNWNTGQVTFMIETFNRAPLFNQPIGIWNVSNVSTMQGLLVGASSFNQPLNDWNTISLLNMSYLFNGATAFNQDISNWVTTSVFTMRGMFLATPNFNQNIGSWNTSNCDDMRDMFYNAFAFNQNLGDWNISDLMRADNMFFGVTLSTRNYDDLLNGWQGQPHNMNVIFSGGNSDYCNGDTARTSLIADSWIINDGNFNCEETYFITTWQTTMPNEIITIPTNSGGYNYDIDWDGDSVFDTLGETGDAVSPMYPTIGNHTIKIRGAFPRIYFNFGSERLKILSVDQWGSQKWLSMYRSFAGCENLTEQATDYPDLSIATVMQEMFSNCPSLNQDLSNWQTRNITDMGDLFFRCTNFNSDISNWDTSNVTDMFGLFWRASSFNQDLSNWDVSSATKMAYMFSEASSFNQDISTWDVSSVTNMSNMFYKASLFNNNDTSLTWLLGTSTSNVTNMSFMFREATAFNQDISTWNVSLVTNMSNMFYKASLFNNNDTSLTWLSGTSTSNVKNMSFMFREAMAFNQDISTWDVSSVTNMIYMFANAKSFDQDISDWDVSSVTDMTYMFFGTDDYNNNNQILDWGIKTVSLTNTRSMFQSAISFNQDISDWDVSSVTNMGYMFFNATSFNNGNQILDWGNKLANVTNMTYMFNLATAFDQDINDWNVSSVTNMERMFTDASSYNNNNQTLTWSSGTGTAQVTTMAFMFQGASSFNQDISSWDISSVTTMWGMFYGATNFNNGNQSLTWNSSTGTAQVTDMNFMFSDCTSFNQDISNWDVSSVANMRYMFRNATVFDQNLGSWDISSLTNATNMFQGVTLSTVNYDALLIGWQTQPHNNNVTFSGGNSNYCLANMSWNILQITDSWTIADGGYGCDDCSASSITWNGVWSSTPNRLTPVTINANYDTSANGDFTSCNCTINNTFTVNIRDGNFISTNDLTNNGSLIIDNNGSLVQNSNTSTISGTGYYRMDRETTPYVEYDYTYWASPTAVETIGDAFNTNSTLIAGASHPFETNDDGFSPPNRIYWFNTQNFNDDILPHDTFDDEGDDWQQASAGLIMNPGVGYIAQGAGADYPFNTNFATGLKQNVYFEGEFNTGNISVPVYQDNSITDEFDNQNLLGNPYPSSLSIIKLMKSNLAVLQGTFYFWSHDSPLSGANPGPNTFDFTNDDYAVATSDGTVFNSVSNGTSGTLPKSYISSGQSVMVNVYDGGGNVIFNNKMRNETPNESYRDINNDTNIDRVWLNLTNEEGINRQILVGFYKNGTNSFDNGLDGERNINGNNYDFYSLIENDDRRFAIQIQHSFDITKTIPLGVEIVETGTFSISISNIEGVFETEQSIYLQDNLTGIIHNLTESDYTFNILSTEGLSNRFVLRFTDGTLDIDDENITNNVTVYPNPSKGIFNISWFATSNMNYTLTDLTGKIIIKKQTVLNSNHTQIDLSSFAKGVYLLKMNLNDNSDLVKKLVIK